jgi:hypothetical protein
MSVSSPFASAAMRIHGTRKPPGERTAALGGSLVFTAALFSLVLFMSGASSREPPLPETLVLLSAQQIPAEKRPPPKEKPIRQREVFADSPEEASPASRPRTMAPAPALPVIPPPAIALAPIELPLVPLAGEGLAVRPGGDSKGDLAQGPQGQGGAGGNGLAGNGSGGAGDGKGKGRRKSLTASWAPDMDFSQNGRVYPREARMAGIEGVAYLRCFALRRDRVRDCRVVAESPMGHGFGAAALKTEKGMRIRVYNQDGRRVYNEWVVVRTIFDMPDRQLPEEQAENAADAQETAP